jgi:hypothetical protein
MRLVITATVTKKVVKWKRSYRRDEDRKDRCTVSATVQTIYFIMDTSTLHVTLSIESIVSLDPKHCHMPSIPMRCPGIQGRGCGPGADGL